MGNSIVIMLIGSQNKKRTKSQGKEKRIKKIKNSKPLSIHSCVFFFFVNPYV